VKEQCLWIPAGGVWDGLVIACLLDQVLETEARASGPGQQIPVGPVGPSTPGLPFLPAGQAFLVIRAPAIRFPQWSPTRDNYHNYYNQN